jgi:hypoxanthine-guanine phosphoribosyltransferase
MIEVPATTRERFDVEDDPHDQIARLEEQIEELAERIERCRKIGLASRIAIALGAIVFAAPLLGALRFDPLVMMAAVSAFIGGIVVFGTNTSTAKQMAADMVRVEALRAALIDRLELRRADAWLPQQTS